MGEITIRQAHVSANVLVVNHAPQIEILKRSSMCITHAGLNTVLESLSNGVPMLALPITNDQPGVAARIANKKVGVVMPPDQASPANLVAAIKRVLGDSTIRTTFGKFRQRSGERTVFRLPQIFLKQHLASKRGGRGRPKIASNARQHSHLLMGYTLLRAISASVAFAARR